MKHLVNFKSHKDFWIKLTFTQFFLFIVYLFVPISVDNNTLDTWCGAYIWVALLIGSLMIYGYVFDLINRKKLNKE